MRRTFAFVSGLAVITVLVSCTSVPPTGDIHESPTSVVRAHIQGYMENNADLILASMAPASRQHLRDQLTADSIEKSRTAIGKVWGVSGSSIDLTKISLKIDEDRGDKKYVDTLYDGKSCEDQATVIKVDGKWYLEWF